MITQPLAEHARVSGLESPPASILKAERQGMNRLVLWGFVSMFIGITIGLIGKKLIHQEIVTIVGVLVSLVGMFLTAYPYLLPAPRQKHDPNQSPRQPNVLTQSETTGYLPPDRRIETIPSITERTTNLLKNSAATTPKQKEDGESQD